MTTPDTDASRVTARSGYSADAWRIIASRGLRQFAYGMLGVTLAVALTGNGFSPVAIGANLLSALSFLAAAPLARRFGLLNTMVFTHLPSNALLLRQLLSQMDVPTRQANTGALVVLGLPLILGGALKAGYDLALWRVFRRVPLPAEPPARRASGETRVR